MTLSEDFFPVLGPHSACVKASQACWRAGVRGTSLNPGQRESWWESIGTFSPHCPSPRGLWNGAFVGLSDNRFDNGSFTGFLPFPIPLINVSWVHFLHIPDLVSAYWDTQTGTPGVMTQASKVLMTIQLGPTGLGVFA